MINTATALRLTINTSSRPTAATAITDQQLLLRLTINTTQLTAIALLDYRQTISPKLVPMIGTQNVKASGLLQPTATARNIR